MSLYVPVLAGSIRRGRNTPRLARLVATELGSRDGVETVLLELADLDLPLLQERLRLLEEPPPGLVELSRQIDRAAAIVIATPEYNKGYPAALKNAIDGLGPEWRRKPVGIVTHSVGAFAGTLVLEQLRIVMMNVGALPIPAALTVPHIDKSIAEDGTPLDEAFAGRAARFVDELLFYTRALSAARGAE